MIGRKESDVDSWTRFEVGNFGPVGVAFDRNTAERHSVK